ncbi:MAG: Xaa-Pro peptidase family protein [Hyphomicrobiaceae bacterium]
MDRYSAIRASIDWEQPFPPEEYAARRARVRQALASQGFDAIYVTSPPDLCWLTGYDMSWFHLRCLTGLLVRAGDDRATMFDYVTHEAVAAATPEIGDIVWFRESGEPSGTAGRTVEKDAAIIASHLSKSGLKGGRIAIQRMGFSPHASTLQTLEAQLDASGMATGDGTVLVERLRAVKSPREMAVMWKAAEIADIGMAAARDMIRPGTRETDIEAAAVSAMMREGGGYPALRTMIGSGPRSGTRHSPPSHRRLAEGDLVYVDFSGCLHRYHVNIVRTFSVGAPDPRIAHMLEKGDGSIAILQQAARRKGARLSDLQKAADAYAVEQGLMPRAWFVGGYLMGLCIPPDWVGNYWVGPRFGMDDIPLEPGVVFNFENQFDPLPEWGINSGVAYIETLMMTEAGLEVMSRLPRTIIACP